MYAARPPLERRGVIRSGIGEHEVEIDGRDVERMRQRHVADRRAGTAQASTAARMRSLDVLVNAIQK